MFTRKPLLNPSLFLPILLAVFLTGCISPKDKVANARLLETTSASKQELFDQINSLTNVTSLRAKMSLKFEDNSYAELGVAEKYKTADSTIVVQRPGKINLKVEVPVAGWDIVHMTSDGEKFRVAIIYLGGSKKYLSFLSGTNKTDYSLLSKKVASAGNGDSKELKENVNAFSNLRPQHFTDAMLMRPTDELRYTYARSSILQEEFDLKVKKKSPLRWVLRGYYLLDEFKKTEDGNLAISRRFWFDRVGGVNLSRQQIFDSNGEIESDIVYGKMGDFTATGEYRMPLEVELTRPKEKYKVRLIHKAPRDVRVGKQYKENAFLLKNTNKLREVDLDKQLLEVKNGGSETSLKNQKK